MFSWVIDKIRYKLFLSAFKPEIIAYNNADGKRIKNSRISNLTHISNKKNIDIGENVFIGHFNYLDGYNQLIIEEGCQITNYVSILTHSSHHAIRLLGEYYTDVSPQIMVSAVKAGLVKIGKYTYVGAHAVIMPGTTIGKGCIVSAYSYVQGDFPDYSVIRGIPATVVGSTKAIDDELLKSIPEVNQYYYDK